MTYEEKHALAVTAAVMVSKWYARESENWNARLWRLEPEFNYITYAYTYL